MEQHYFNNKNNVFSLKKVYKNLKVLVVLKENNCEKCLASALSSSGWLGSGTSAYPQISL